MTTNDAERLCPACHHRDHDPGSCGECPRCELHYDEAFAWATEGQPDLLAAERLPQGTRLILAAEDLLAMWGARTVDGYRITAEWGEQQPEGWYEPTFTVDYTDDLKAAERRATVERIRAVLPDQEYDESEDASLSDEIDGYNEAIRRVHAILDAAAER